MGDDDILQLGGRVTAADGYEGAWGRYTLIVAPYPDPDKARRAFEHVLANLDPEVKLLSRAAERLVFPDYSGAYGEGLLTESRIELRLGLAQLL